MKASELRIGNLINVRCVAPECGHDDFEPQECNIHNLISLFDESKDFEFEPIPLTEEWHNKFGCIKNGFNSFEYSLPIKNNLYIKLIFTGDYVFLRQGKGKLEDDVVSIWNKDLTKRDMYVHEWQNLYYTLTGEELILIEKI